MKRLYYFTDSYPFSVDYTWKSAEIEEASKKFSEVIIIPFTFQKNQTISFPENVRIETPTLGKRLFAKPKYLKHVFSKTQPQNWGKELLRAIPKGKQAIIDWFLATIYSNIIVQQPIFKELRTLESKNQSVLFFQWTMNNALVVPVLKKWGFQHIICRMHGFDLYEYRHNDYIPYKEEVLKRASICTFISAHGREYAKQLYPFVEEKSYVHYLGAKALETNRISTTLKFHLISISRAVPLKRIELIIDALKTINLPIKWTHIGDGILLDRLKQRAMEIREVNTQCEVEFTGWLNPDEITTYLNNTSINALILVSETEGLPVVIMEAFSASIPVIATDVGGVSELVNENTGVLLSSNPTNKQIVKAIELLFYEPNEIAMERRNNAYSTYLSSFDLRKNSKIFIDFLASQCQ